MKTIYVICFFPFYVYDSNQIFALDLCLMGYIFWEILFLFFLIWFFFLKNFLQILFLCFVDLVFCTTFILQVGFLQVLFLCLGCTSIFNFQSCKFASQVLFFQEASRFQMCCCFMLESPKCGITKSHTFSKNSSSL